VASFTDLKRVRLKVKRDKRYKEMDLALTFNRDKIKTDSWRREMEINHRDRKIGKLRVKDPNFFKKMTEACAFEVSCRSRLAEMSVVCSDIERSLKSQLDYFSDYVLITYSADLKIFSTIKERTKFTESIMRKFQGYLDDMTTLRMQIHIYMEDIDKAGYAIKNMVSVFEVIMRNEGHINLR
jgi:hypothetical protein